MMPSVQTASSGNQRPAAAAGYVLLGLCALAVAAGVQTPAFSLAPATPPRQDFAAASGELALQGDRGLVSTESSGDVPGVLAHGFHALSAAVGVCGLVALS